VLKRVLASQLNAALVQDRSTAPPNVLPYPDPQFHGVIGRATADSGSDLPRHYLGDWYKGEFDYGWARQRELTFEKQLAAPGNPLGSSNSPQAARLSIRRPTVASMMTWSSCAVSARMQYAEPKGLAGRLGTAPIMPDKGKVERFIRYLWESFWVPLSSRLGQEGLSVDCQTANLAVRRWLREVANARIHGTTGAIPAERLASERLQLLPIPTPYGGRKCARCRLPQNQCRSSACNTRSRFMTPLPEACGERSAAPAPGRAGSRIAAQRHSRSLFRDRTERHCQLGEAPACADNASVRVEIYASEETVEIFIEADFETLPQERRRFALLNIPRHLFSESHRRSSTTGREPSSCAVGVISDFGIDACLRLRCFRPQP
jgi:hypothetical protein